MPSYTHETDIAVIGAGLSGVCAAVSAARLGKRVVILEKDSAPGGRVRSLRHGHLCGLYANGARRPRRLLNNGFSPELVSCLVPRPRPRRMGKVWVLPYDPRNLTNALRAVLRRESLADLSCSSRVISWAGQGRRITSLVYERAGRKTRLAPRAVIVAGSGILDGISGAVPFTRTPRRRQLGGYTVEVASVRYTQLRAIEVPYLLRRAVESGLMPQWLRWTQLSPLPDGRVMLKFSVPLEVGPVTARRIAVSAISRLRRASKAWRAARVRWHALMVYPRDGSFLRGSYTLTENDLITGRTFSDNLGRAAWPVEFWDEGRGPQYLYPPEGGYGIPAGSLCARGSDNLFAAGTAVCADYRAAASLRAAGVCMSTGEAAGILAAKSVR